MRLCLSTLSRFALVLAPAAVALACTVDSAPPEISEGSSSGPYPTGYPSADADVADDGGASAHPILALVDTNQTMNATPGEGLGVFVEYDTGGNWNVWWSCGPEQNGSDPPCQFDVKISAARMKCSAARLTSATIMIRWRGRRSAHTPPNSIS